MDTHSTTQRDNSISIIRFIALIMIIACHFCQYYGLELAWWLNVGVQVFLCISGFLYGRRKTGDVMGFYFRRFRKILIPYYNVVAVFALFMFAFRGGIPLPDLGRMLIMTGTVSGGGHLWFVPTILFCYVITPLLEKAFELPFVRGRVSFAFVTLMSMAVAALFCMGFAEGYDQTCIVCYIIGYALGANSIGGYFKEGALRLFFALLALMNAAQIYFDYIKHPVLSGGLLSVYELWSRYNHVWLGVFLFLLLKKLFAGAGKGEKLLNLLDAYSYETYLVHQFFILGPFSLPGAVSVTALAVPLTLVCIAFAAFVLKKLCGLWDSPAGRKGNGL